VKYSLDFLRGMHGAPAEAADAIERLETEVERLRAALEVIAEDVRYLAAVPIARAALAKDGK